MISVIDAFECLNLDIMACTETWLFDGPAKKKAVEDLGGEVGISMIARNRRGRGAGVAILYQDSSLKLKEYKFKRKHYEILAVKGTHSSVRGTLYIFVVYIKPSLNAQQKSELLELLTDVVIQVKTKEDNPKIYVMGDFNKVQTDVLTLSLPTLIQLDSPPTRNEAHLDIIITNTPSAAQSTNDLLRS